MSKSLRIIFYSLISLVMVLAATTVFFIFKSMNKSDSKENISASANKTSAGEGSLTSTPQVASSSSISKPASSSERPSHPTDTYTIQKGETLFEIAKKNGTTLFELTQANALSDQDKILSGQKLIIPKNGKVGYTIDNSKATELQSQADYGRLPARLSPEETCRLDAPDVFGLAFDDSFIIVSRDDNTGKAQVKVNAKAGGNFLIGLSQPIKKGDKGIWAIEEITPAT